MKLGKIWNSGYPKEIGWYPASVVHNKTYWRWYDGKQWSQVALSTDKYTERQLNKIANTKVDTVFPIDYLNWTR